MVRKTAAKFIMAIITISIFAAPSVLAHCEIPCGIYTDELRIHLIKEHITTLEKSMNQINTLSKEGEKNYNQLVRWVGNKDTHANEIQHIVTQYFMTQRVKPADHSDEAAHTAYLSKVAVLHQMLVHAMKAKQTTDLAHIQHLRDLTDKFVTMYFDEDAQKHLMDHHK